VRHGLKKNIIKIAVPSCSIWMVEGDPDIDRFSNDGRLIQYMRDFAHLIASLSTIFDYPQNKVHLFYENKETIAFNRNTELFFNV